jgi:hypothetical protein
MSVFCRKYEAIVSDAVSGDISIIACKGDKLIRVMDMTCPCNTTTVEPLVQKLAAAL